MRKVWRLTKRAEHALFRIALWTQASFGNRQAEIYEQELIACCEAIANGSARKQSCRVLFDRGLPDRLQATRIGSHFAIFIESDTEIVIIDFLHARRDLPSHLNSLSGEGDD